MRVLIVEDNAFNAFCLMRLLQTAFPSIQVTVANNSLNALQCVENELPSLVILDGDLGVSDGLQCNGPTLADTLWQSYPSLPLIAWTDSENMRQAFAEIFKQHKKVFNEMFCWPKIVSHDRICLSFAYLTSNCPMQSIERPYLVQTVRK